ncbi:unnamed protein product [Urochloa decumbens]
MVKDKASSYLLDQYQVMEGMEEQHEVLKRKLPAILDVIGDAEEQAAKHREGAKAWLEAVRKVAYKANDVLDEFKYEALRRKAKAEGHYKALGMDVIKLFPTHNRVVFRYKMANKLRMIVQEIDVLIAEMIAFRFKFKPQPPMSMKWRQTDACIPTDSLETASKSRAQEKKDLVGRLLAQASSVKLTVLPIVGMGGLGKTTLAQLVYNDPQIQKHFELRLWVCVSDDFDVDSLAARIVKENGAEASGSSALEKLQNAVSGKRYLLVLDDVWNRDEPSKWEKLKSYLQHGGSGSSVVTTTRDEAVAKLMMGTPEGAYKLGSLDEECIGKIIKRRAFGSKQETEWPDELVKMVGEVAKKCAGSPLAATALGSLLGTKTSKQEWDAVLNRSTICDEDNGILPVLKLSYNGLPSHMRQCFAFCAMFPKDYEINVEMLIQLWMANGFIPEKKGEHPEIIGKHIFVDLASRSFFQDVKGSPFMFGNTAVSKVSCKIHDLMHDVAMDSMGNECATVATEQSKTEDDLHSARHLYLSVDQPETILNASLEKGSPTSQTLICGGHVKEDMKILSKYNCIRALKISCGSFVIRPKYLHHLRYLDLSGSYIKVLPEDISILYHLQTLNLSYCGSLKRLPKGLKYLTALHHLYTHGCGNLESMPAELGHLTSLQTLTYFVAGTDSGCSNLGELQNLDLGGKLELSRLGNVTGADAQAAGLGNKKKLTEVELRWTGSAREAQNNNHKEVVERLKPHDGLKLLRIYFCGSNTFPTWMNTLRGMVELELIGCKKLGNLPALWELPALQILCLRDLMRLHCLCSGGTTPVTFPKLKVLRLLSMPSFKVWWDTDELQGEAPIFPKVEKLYIGNCVRLTALPKAASVITESSGGVDTKCRSAFPALREMTLSDLTKFDRWEAVEGTLGEGVTFPQLEELSIWYCTRLSALPKGSLLVNQSFGGAETVRHLSAFPALRKLHLSGLSALERWGAVEGTPGLSAAAAAAAQSSRSAAGPQAAAAAPHPLGLCSSRFGSWLQLLYRQLAGCSCCSGFTAAAAAAAAAAVAFPLLEDLMIHGCPRLIDLPEAPKLSKLVLGGNDQQISLQAASRCIPSLSMLILDAAGTMRRTWDRKPSLPAMWLIGCNHLFSHSRARALWRRCFAQLVDLEIRQCDALDYWPENVFQVLVCLKNLSIVGCSKLTGRTQASDEQSTPAPERGELLPRLESLLIAGCESLVEVPNLPTSLKTLRIGCCSNNIKSIVFGQQEDTSLVGGERVVRPDTSSSIPGSGSSEATASTAVLKLSSAANHRFFPCLKSLEVWECRGLSGVANLPPSIKTLDIMRCRKLQSLSGQLDAVQILSIFSCSRLESLESCLGDLRSLEELKLCFCKSLVSLPDGPQAYSSLRVLRIKYCDGIKLLPPSLQSRLGYLEEKDLDAHLEEPKTLTRAMRRLVENAATRLFPCLRDNESDSD